MRNHLDRLAVDAYPGEDVRGAVFARQERIGAKLAFLLVPSGLILSQLLGWPSWLGAVVGSAAAGAVYSLLCRNFVLVVCGVRILIHRPPAVWWYRVPLGTFEKAIGTDSLRAGRKGLFNDTWWVDGVEMHVEKDLSWHVTELLDRQAAPRPGATGRLA